MRERDFQRQVVELAEKCGWMVYHVAKVKGQLRAATSVGFPDLCLCRERVIFAELKQDGEDLRDDQKRWATKLLTAGADHRVWTPSMWDGIENTLTRRRA